jgi:hypothetical protein
MTRTLRAALLAATLAACTTAPPADPDAPVAVKGMEISPLGIHEECRALAPGDRLDYRFASSAPLAFNIHYHDGNAIVIPIAHEGVTADSGIFHPALPQDYCLMWQAGNTAITLEYRVAVRRKPPG